MGWSRCETDTTEIVSAYISLAYVGHGGRVGIQRGVPLFAATHREIGRLLPPRILGKFETFSWYS